MTCAVFDLDGTLIDSAPDIQWAANACLRPFGLDPLTLEETHAFIGNGAASFIEKLRKARGIADDRQETMLAGFLQHYENAVSRTVFYPGAFESLTVLKAHGVKLGLCTNKPLSPCLKTLDHMKLAPLFDTVWAGDSLPQRKPDPAPLLAAFDRLGEGPRIYVGDTEVDASAAERAGVPFLYYTLGYRRGAALDQPVAAQFDDFSALPALIAKYAN